MSSSEENFDIENVSGSGSESEDYAPAPKKAKAAAKPKAVSKAAKAPAKPKAAPERKKVLVEKDDNADDVDMEKPSDDEAGPSAAAATPLAPTKKKTASETYTKLSQLEHILKRPDSYIGSVETITQPMWVWDSDNKRIAHREIKYVPGFFKIVDEILVNAADNKITDPSMDTIKITIDPDNNLISVYNNGRGIPIEMHSKEKIYIPELIFGHLLSSSNYDDDEKKLTGGRNGYGAKLANIYSTEFTLDTAEKNSGQKYVQTWTDNMSKMGKAKITKNGRGEEYTRVTFKPDLKRFGMDAIDEDAVALLKKRVHDMAGTVKEVKVWLNGERIKLKGFKQYVDLYLNSVTEQAAEVSGGAAQSKPTMIFEAIGSRWEVAFAVSEGTFQQVSFANSISTIKGGTHVALIAEQIAKNLLASIQKKNKAATVKPAQIKSHMWIFVNALIENPTFDSQTKETLTLPASKFGTKPVLSEDFMKKVQKSSIVDHVLNWAKFKADQQMKKTDGNRRNRLSGMPKLSDANNAGTKKASECTLILTEGDSAKTLAVAGLSVVGRDNYGVFPLRGKLLNVRDAKHDQIMKNEEIQNLKKIIGLQHNKDYQDTSGLRYGRVMLMTDQDHDGSHIKGLLINYFDHFYPSLLKVPKFLVEFITPIVRVTKGPRRIDFYTMPEYQQWKEETPQRGWRHKYFKGLGTSQDTDAREYFKLMRKHMIPFSTTQDGDRELIELAFSKKKADERKEWLRQCKPGTFLDHSVSEIPFSDFINRELILFSMADNIRSIPSMVDGLKPGQRKVIWSCFKRKLQDEVKVAQLVGYVSEHSDYHHGEQSLMSTIVNLAQDFVGSNNMNLLMPNGQFGSRDQGGKDHASARYIYTELAPITRSVFHVHDDPLMAYQDGDDAKVIEPDFYVPILPMVLVNGAEGIGTGWSTSIPCYDPEDIVANIRRLMADEEQVPMLPWWRGFKGTIRKVAENKYDVAGIVNKTDETTVEITELPIGRWTQNYKVELEAMCGEKGDGPIKDYKEYHNNTNVHFVVTLEPKNMEKAEAQGFLEFFKLTSRVSTSNMICFNFDGQIKKYNTAEEIIEEFYPKRLAYYQMRKDYMANQLQTELARLTNQARFVQMIVKKELVVTNRKKVDIVTELRQLDFRPFPKAKKAKKAGETEDVVENDDEGDDDDVSGGNTTDFDYLLGMAIWSLTKEKIDKLLQQAVEKEQELLVLLELSPIILWQKDLDRFLEEWKVTCLRWEDKIISADTANKTGKRRQATLKQMMKKVGGSNDSEDEFRPTKAAAKAKSKATVAKKASQAGSSGSRVKVEDDDSDNVKPQPAKKSTRRAVKDEDESDFEMGEGSTIAPLNKPLNKRATTAKRALPKAEEDSDLEITPPSGKGKARAAPSPKRKSPDDDGDKSDDDALIVPVKKKKAETNLTDFFDKAPPKKPTAQKPSSSTQAAKSRVASGKKAASEDNDDASSDDELIALPPKPTARKPSSSRPPPAKQQAPRTGKDDSDFLMDDDLAPPKTARKASGSKSVVAPRKKAVYSDDDITLDDIPSPPARSAAPKRAARIATKSYIEILSSEDDDGGQDASEFEDFD